ncbi:hypothetical protein BURCE16_35090 [Burkholderia cepacia]|nr:hypothetical protein BURCE16_35090 [Burkholderia cepacia]
MTAEQQVGHLFDPSGIERHRGRAHDGGPRRTAHPGRLEIDWKHERRDATPRAHRGGNRVGRIRRDIGVARHAAIPHRHRTGERFNVRRQRCVVLQMLARVIADDVQDRRAGAARIVQVGNAVRVAGAEMQQRHRGLAGHAAIAVRGARAHALEQPEDRAHARHGIERTDERHLGRAWIGKTDVDTGVARRGEHDARPASCFGIAAQLWDVHAAARRVWLRCFYCNP